jgi:hypothetical protein
MRRTLCNVLFEASSPKVPTTFTLDEVFCPLFEQFPFPRLHLLSEPSPVIKMSFLTSFSFRAQTSGAFHKSIGGSYLKLAGAYCDSVRGTSARRQHVAYVFLGYLSCLWCHQYFGRDKVHYPERPSFSLICLQSQVQGLCRV